MEEFYGIDLGTTNSCIAIIDEDDSVTVVTNAEGQLITPSVVAYEEDGKPYVGESAKHNMSNDPERTVSFIKREMSNENYHRKIGNLDINPIDVSAEILKKLVGDANKKRQDEEGKEPINKVVITVPAYFGNAERTRTTEAGKRAGLDVITLINEPTAAALSFGIKNKQNRTILVYDLGGGTFDVSIMKINACVMDTLATNGNHQLGGVDWDEKLVEYALQKENFSVTCKELKENDMQTYGSLVIEAENAKKILSTKDKTTLRYNYKGIKNTEITREEFEELTTELMNMTGQIIDVAMEMAGNPKIDDVLLVGGSSRMPMVKKFVEKKLGITTRVFEPDLAVAKGAALYAAQVEKRYTEVGIQLGNDKGSASYGVAAYVGEKEMVCNLILMNDDLCVKKSFDEFSTRADGQTSVHLAFYESRVNEDVCELYMAQLLQEGDIEWGCPVPKGTPLKYVVERGKDGIVKVHAEIQGRSADFVINTKGISRD